MFEDSYRRDSYRRDSYRWDPYRRDPYRRDSYRRRETTAKAKTKPAFDLDWEQFVLDSAQIRNYCPIHKPHMFT